MSSDNGFFMRLKESIAICTTSDISTDYRLHKMALTMLKAGHKPYFVARKRKGYKNISDSFPVKIMAMFFEKGPLFYLEFNIRLFFYLLSKPPDIIFSVDLDSLPASRFAKMFNRKSLIFDSHEYFPEVPELQHRPAIKKVWQLLERWIIPGIDFGVTVCEPIADIYKEKYNKTFKVIRNLPLANKTEETLPKTKNSEFTMIYQGAVNIGRGLKESVESLLYLKNVNLIIVGNGDLFGEIKELIEAHKLSHRVILTGRIPFQEIKKHTKKADLGLCIMENIGLNYYYSLPNRIFDYIQLGVPILAIDFPEIKKVVEGYDVGLCVSSLDPKKLAEAITQIRENGERFKSWKTNTSTAASELVWENEEQTLIDILTMISL